MPELAASARARLPDSAFAYVDSQGRRRLPINDASHVRNALARFDQTSFEDDVARERARQRLLRAAKKYGIVPIGFFDGQLRKERMQTEVKARARDIASLPRGQQLGDGYATLLRDVRALIRKSVRDSGGHEVDARADEFFAVFRQPTRALDAAVGIQRSLQKHEWPDRVEVCVRIGIHTGRTTLSETGYVGIAVNTAARVCSAGHGGQILLTSASRDAVEGSQATGIVLRTLGRYALAGLPEPEALFQVYASDLRVKFPKLRTTAVVARRSAPRSR